MSKIAEKKALEVYPEIEGSETYFDREYICTKPIDLNRQRREGYVKGYDQAMQDFLEEACEWLLHNTMRELVMNSESTELVEDFIEDFKNHMENESEN